MLRLSEQFLLLADCLHTTCAVKVVGFMHVKRGADRVFFSPTPPTPPVAKKHEVSEVKPTRHASRVMRHVEV